MEQEETLCDEEETVIEHTYLGEKVNAGGGCEASVTARTRCWCDMCIECGKLVN